MEPYTTKELSPSEWSHRGSADFVINEHISFATNGSNAAKSNYKHTERRPISSSHGVDSHPYDVYYPATRKLPNNISVVVFVHGGYWEMLSKEVSSYMASAYLDHGCVVVVVGYTLAPFATISEMTEQVAISLADIPASIHDYMGCSTAVINTMSIIGHSAGAQLAYMAFRQATILANKVQLVLLSGVYDLAPIIHTDYNKNLHLTPETAKQASPIHHTNDTKNCNIIIAFAEFDPPHFITQSLQFHTALTNNKGGSSIIKLIEVKDTDHFTIVEQLSTISGQINQHIL